MCAQPQTPPRLRYGQRNVPTNHLLAQPLYVLANSRCTSHPHPSFAPLSEPQKLVARSIMGNILFNTPSAFIGGDFKPDDLGKMFKDWVSEPSNVARTLLRHAFIPAVTHILVHNVGSMAAHAAAMPMDIFPEPTEVASALAQCANSVVCMAELQATLLPNAMDALGDML
jgi:hypothetical protein